MIAKWPSSPKRLGWLAGPEQTEVKPQMPIGSKYGTSGGRGCLSMYLKVEKAQWLVSCPLCSKNRRLVDLGLVGMVWAGPDVLWATYSNGSLVQHDLRECYRPLDSLPRSALAWDPSGAVTWATELVSSSEIPYDDV